MTGEVLIPCQLIEPLRDGLRSQLALAARHVTEVEERPDAGEEPERYGDPLRDMDALRDLLEQIGWSAPPSDTHVELGPHGWALIQALQDQIAVHADMLRDSAPSGARHATIAGEMNALSTLALTVLLRIQAHSLRPTAPRE